MAIHCHCCDRPSAAYDVIFAGDVVYATVTRDPSAVSQWIRDVSSLYGHRLIVGLDIEWRPNHRAGEQNPAATLQLCVGRCCLIYQLIHSAYFPVQLIRFLSYSDHDFVGIGVKSDLRKLQRDHRIGYNAKTVDSGKLAADVYKTKELKFAGLKTMARIVLGKEMEKPKSVTRSRWDERRLTTEQGKMEAAVSAYAVNSKWWLGLGLGLGRQRVVNGTRKQSLLISNNGVGYTRKMTMTMMRNNMNCTRRFRMESSWMAIERQRFKEGRFVMAEAASGSSAQGGDVDNIASVLPYVGVACLGVGAVMFGIGYHLGGYILSKSTTGITSTTDVAARVLVVAANIIGTIIALLDKLGCKGLLPTSFSRMINFTGSSRSSSLLLNVKSSDDIDTFARVIDLTTAGVPLEIAQVLVEDTKDLPQSKFDSLVKIIHLDEQHKKETKSWRLGLFLEELTNWLCYSIFFCIVAFCWWFGGIGGLLYLVLCLVHFYNK